MKTDKFIHKKPFLIAGPCSAESEKQTLTIAHKIKNTIDVFRAGVWKPRTHPNSFEGIGKEALKWLRKVQIECKLKVATEVAKNETACFEDKTKSIFQKRKNVHASTARIPMKTREAASHFTQHQLATLLETS